MKYLKLIILTIIIAIAALLRFYKLDQVPPSLNWDEIAAGYNAYTIAHWGADEYGNKFPIVFKSFADDKHPVHIYITAVVVKIFGLTDYSARAGSALVGTLAVVSLYFLVKKIFKSDVAGLFSALFLAISPYHLQFSRGLWENNFAFFFLVLGLTLFYYGIEKGNWLLPASVGAFGLSFFSYHSAKIVVPIVVLTICLFNIKKIFKNKKILTACVLVALLFGALTAKNPRILGLARVGQTKFAEETINKYGGTLQTYIHNYKSYFSYSYLFELGDQSSRASVKVIGEFYKLDLILCFIGIAALLLKRKWQALTLLIVWLAVSPIPGVVSSLEPSATRGIFMIGPILCFSGYGAYSITSILKKRYVQILVTVAILAPLFFEVKNYLTYYYKEYSNKNAIEWQYGMKQIVEYLANHDDSVQVYMDKIRQQPYIFFLYYLKTPLPELLKTVRYDQSQSKSYNTVVSFDKYQFGGNWNIIESYPTYGIVYIMTPSYYSGLRYINDFEVKKLIKYPDGSDAFYIVEGYK